MICSAETFWPASERREPRDQQRAGRGAAASAGVPFWLWLFLLTLRELTIASIVFSPDNVTLPVVIWNLWNSRATAPAAAAAATVIMMGTLLPIVLVYGQLVVSRAF